MRFRYLHDDFVDVAARYIIKNRFLSTEVRSIFQRDLFHCTKIKRNTHIAYLAENVLSSFTAGVRIVCNNRSTAVRRRKKTSHPRILTSPFWHRESNYRMVINEASLKVRVIRDAQSKGMASCFPWSLDLRRLERIEF